MRPICIFRSGLRLAKPIPHSPQLQSVLQGECGYVAMCLGTDFAQFSHVTQKDEWGGVSSRCKVVHGMADA